MPANAAKYLLSIADICSDSFDFTGFSGDYLPVLVKHEGGWLDGAYTYRNVFSCVRSEKENYAPPLRTDIPRIDGVTIAPNGATGDLFPTLNEYGHYNVNMSFRLAQPSGGMSDDMVYGIHFPVKRGAEMVLAYVDGNPDKPVGLGFVPNAAALSVVRSENYAENIMRTWGGNELVMDDTRNNKSVKLSSEGERYLELHDGDELVRVKSENCEMLFSDNKDKKFARIEAGQHKIHIDYGDDSGKISITTAKGNIIKMNDPNDTITVQNAGEDGGKKINKVVLNGDDKSITLDSMDNTMVVNGKDKRITLESEDNKVVVDGGDNSVTVNAKTNVIIKAGGNLVFGAEKGINIKSGGKLIINAKGGIVNKSPTFDITKSGQASSQSNSVKSEKKAKDMMVVTGITGDRKENGENINDADDTENTLVVDDQFIENGDDNSDSQETEGEEEGATVAEETKPKITEIYWTYGKNYTRLCDKKEGEEDVFWQSKYRNDLNLHIVTEEGNDGKMMTFVLETEDKQKINLRKVISENNVVFDKVFIK